MLRDKGDLEPSLEVSVLFSQTGRVKWPFLRMKVGEFVKVGKDSCPKIQAARNALKSFFKRNPGTTVKFSVRRLADQEVWVLRRIL